MAQPGAHLDPVQKEHRKKILAAIEHIRAGGTTHAEAVAGYLREVAFTTLNRFVALKMLEARGLVQECISRGEQSAGFKEFTGLAPGLVQARTMAIDSTSKVFSMSCRRKSEFYSTGGKRHLFCGRDARVLMRC